MSEKTPKKKDGFTTRFLKKHSFFYGMRAEISEKLNQQKEAVPKLSLDEGSQKEMRSRYNRVQINAFLIILLTVYLLFNMSFSTEPGTIIVYIASFLFFMVCYVAMVFKLWVARDIFSRAQKKQTENIPAYKFGGFFLAAATSPSILFPYKSIEHR